MAQERDLEILKTAQKLILRHGYSKVTMKDVAEACEISRPTLYKSFASKEEIIAGLIDLQIESCSELTKDLVGGKGSLQSKLEKFFDAWTISPSAIAIDSEMGRDLLANVEKYAPEAVQKNYRELERQLTQLLKTEMKKKKGSVTPEDTAHILTLAVKGLKASSGSLGELRRMVNGLIHITCASL